MTSRHSHLKSPAFGRISLMLALAFAGFAMPTEAVARSKAEVAARDLGREMAAAKFCNLDPSRINVLNQAFDNEILNISESRRDYVDSQQVYLENVAKYERREPREGCEAVINRLQSPEQQDIRALNDRMRTLEDLTIRQLDIIQQQQEQLDSQ